MAMDYEAMGQAGGIGGDAGDLIGTIFAEILNAPTYAEAERLREQAMAEYNIDLPPVQSMQAQAVQSQAAGAQGNAQAKAARMRALQAIEERGAEGYNAEDKAAVNETLNDVALAERGRREALMKTLSPNSGAALAARLSSQQQAANQANSQALSIAGQSRRNALMALEQSGQLGGSIDAADFGQAHARGQSQDAISRFNESNRIDVGRWNAAQQQQAFNNKLGLADRKSEGFRTRAQDKEDEANSRSRKLRGGFRAGGSLAGAAWGA